MGRVGRDENRRKHCRMIKSRGAHSTFDRTMTNVAVLCNVTCRAFNVRLQRYRNVLNFTVIWHPYFD
jgi:hypothetical protein